MSGYLSRLVARAGGVPAPVSIAPGPRPPVDREAGSDPFEVSAAPTAMLPAGTPSPTALPPSVPAERLPPLHAAAPARRAPVVQEGPIGMAPPLSRPEPPEPGEEAPRRKVEREAHPAPLGRPTPPRVEPPRPPPTTVSGREEVTEHTPMVAPIMHPPAMSGAKEVREAPPSVAIRQPEQAELVEAAAPIEPHPPVSLPPATVIRESEPHLAPPPPEPHTAVTPAPEQPRLVIGRMRVEVIPTPPAPVLPMVRVIEKLPASDQAGRLTSPLRFGLGQM